MNKFLTSSPVKEVKEVKEVKVAKPHKRKKFHNLAVHVQDFSFLLGVYIAT